MGRSISILAIIGNLLFIVWIMYNGINEGFEGATIEKTSYTLLMLLLAVNSILLIRYGKMKSDRK